MKKLVGFALVFCLFTSSLFAQKARHLIALPLVHPTQDAQLHYRIIGFTFPAMKNVKKYTIQIAGGKYFTEAMFNLNTIITIKSDSNKIVAEVPSFSAQYTWRYIYQTDKGLKKSELRYFSTVITPLVDSNNTRLLIVRNTNKYKDAFVFIDCTRAIYDMHGRPVWYLPETLLPLLGNGKIQDLRFTPQGTITFINNMVLNEINYNGKLLNQISNRDPERPSPNGDLHHQADRLKNGHYMVLGNEVLDGKEMSVSGGMEYETQRTPVGFQNSVFGTLDEFDENGELVWQYRLSDYFVNYKSQLGKGNSNFDIHLNAFWFDEDEKYLYLGFKNISRIFKIKYPEGKLVGVLGGDYSPGQADVSHNVFCHQHAFFKKSNGLYVYNNNDLSNNPVPEIEFFKDETDGVFENKPIWRFQFPVTTKSVTTTSGGNVMGLPNGDIFASLSMPYNDLYIIDTAKSVLWQAEVEKKDDVTNIWQELPTYKASIISSAGILYSLILKGLGE